MELYHINKNAQPTGEHEVHTSSCAHGPSIENRINLGFFHNSSEAIREVKKYYNNKRIKYRLKGKSPVEYRTLCL